MNSNKKGLNTICTHVGELEDKQHKGAVSPLYMSTSYAYEDVDVKRYPRYFNTPNQEGLCKKVAALEHAESALIFGSGMAAVSTALLAFLNAGDHVVLQQTLYGGTYNLVNEEFSKYGIQYSFTEGWHADAFEAQIKENTKVIYIETPSNPLLTITDLEAVAALAKKHGIITLIDNTFASPVNQNPIDFGIDVVIHSATKYMGGHSDICAGAVASTAENIERIFHLAKNFGGSLSDYTVWLLERSMKTMGIRVRAQNENALEMAYFLDELIDIEKVYYPGLPSHPEYDLAKKQMKGFGGMLSFELKENLDSSKFQKALNLIKPSMSLAGVESTVISPTQTSHALMSAEVRAEQGIADGLIRFSVGIEEAEDLKEDILQAIALIK
ncbi:aminotransferase class I/II-fold pyridoxal phosphate-dependent enzyme [Maribacter sp. M208]|uniref:trans-sulfuration enzyme family protein n=1 Tax=Maribacter huludaoensis TaxID=3030010 RepID=UPI0023EC240A|nr:aminotransferase class I/II-fold pyridoxal phosphate-dependent enzyme [Maribacter huludaoensis]MDF4223160.1 aminotransferase class I/II-fold pyridoxal phosphate-dependent enzyme [Maribacter huludaoensis]